jgi:hypothetical protein
MGKFVKRSRAAIYGIAEGEGIRENKPLPPMKHKSTEIRLKRNEVPYSVKDLSKSPLGIPFGV